MASTSNSIQTAPSTLSSSFLKPQWKYEVFLSFRGKDTRYTFTDHLYDALVDKGIVTFRDDEELEMGRPIKPELLSAIETSRMAVIILSRNYASSTWCLEELAKILECMKERGMRVLPVFYYLDPSAVRYQKGTFADAFAKHEERFKDNKEMVQRWRAALREVADLSGTPLNDGQSESKFIKLIVEEIFHELNDTTSSIYKNDLVGIDSRVAEMNSYIDTASDDVRFIGICGMSGIGKTTLAEEVFERIRGEFQASSFLRNVKTRKLVDLQDQLLLDMKLKTKRGEWDTRKGINLTSNRLRNKKVLVVLDDVDEEEQLETLAGSREWYGPGSRIIITTEDNQLLRKNIGEQNIYKARKLNASDALLLFSQETFRKPHCKEAFSDLCNEFVSYAEGLPLALKVLGASLFGKRIELWKEARDRLKANPRRKIQDTLKISFDGLEDTEKKLFLHIACFFKGEDKDRVTDILQGSGCHPNIDIDTLMDKSLITILERKLWMHNLLQQVGWEIVRQESLEEPGRRSRLWLWEDVHRVLEKNTGTTAVEGIMLNTPPHEKEHLNAEAFSKMENLKLLQICNVQLPQGLSYLSNELRLMEWHEYPLKSMPRSFQPDKLVELIMPRSHIKELPKGFNNLGRLKLMDLSDSQNLIKTPNFTGLPNLERVIFQGCTRLHEVHLSIGVLKRLTLLNLKDCKYLYCLPPEINLESLEIFILSGCSRLNKFPEIGRSMTRLSKLYLDETSIEELPLSFEHLTGLTFLTLRDCKNISSFPNVICNLTSLKNLTLSGCKGQPPKPWHSLGQSTHLNIFDCAALILLTYCSFGSQHPKSEPTHLLLPKSFSGLSSLESLELSDCNLLDGALPDDLSCLSSLQLLDLSRNNFTGLPDSISQLSKLKFLDLDNCRRLQSLPNLPLSTQLVMARECTSLENYSNQVIVWTSGETGFTFIDCRSLGDDEERKISKLYLLDKHFQPLWQRQLEELVDLINGFCGVIPQIEIPKWFSHQNNGSSVPIMLPPHLYENSSWRGIALCTVFVVDKNLHNEDSKRFHEFICRLDMDGGVVDSPLVFTFPKDVVYHGWFGLWQYISHARFRDHLDVRGCISPSVTTNSPGVEIKLCGARLVYEEDMVEFVQNFSQAVFGSHNDRSGSSQSDGYEAKSKFFNGQSYSIPRLERNLKTLLSMLYQEDPARNHWYDYIFPQISIPNWFIYQNFLSDIRMQLPPDLHYNTRWTGFSVYALYTVDKQPAGNSCQDSTMFLRFSGLSAGDEAPFAPYLAFPLSGDNFVESPRLLVFYIPRVLFQLNQCSEIWASFQSDNPRVEVEMSGIRLVYEQDIEEFVQTLVQCILRCPYEYREFYYRSLLAQVEQLQGCDHGKDFGCSFSSQRRPQPMPKLLPSIENVAEEGCASPETLSNKVIAGGTSRNSSPFQGRFKLGIPLRDDQQYGSSISGILESWYKTDLQECYNLGGVFNQCFPQSEIPQWFSHQSDTPSVTIPLHPYLYYNFHWMGVAVCAAFSFHKHPTAIRMNLDSGIRHPFMCHLETDLGRLTPLSYSIGEDDVLISLYRRSFLWVLFIPRRVLSHQWWSQSTWADFSFISDSPDVSALKCGVGLVDRQNMEEFCRTIAQLITSDVGYVKEIIRSSSKEGAVYDRLPIYHGKIGGYEHPRRQNVLPISLEDTTARDSYHEDPDPRNRFYNTGPLDFNPFLYYNFCFPPSEVAQEWFSGHQSRGHSVTIDIPLNLYHDNNWMGLALCASFSMGGDDPKTILDHLVSEIPHFLTSTVAGQDDFLIACCTSRREIMWLANLGRFIWISYVPGEQLKNMLRQCSRIEASFVSDWPCVTVQKCGLRLFYQHDQVEFEQKLKHCDALIFEYEESMSQFMSDQEKINERNPDNEVGLRPTAYSTKDFAIQIFERPIDQAQTHDQLGKSDLLDFDGCSEFNLRLPPREILNWFSHRSNGPSVTIDDLYDDGGWMGLFLCACFSVHDQDQTEKLDSAISHQLICCLKSNVAGPEPELHVHGTTQEELRRLYIQDEFLWLSYIPRGSLPDWLNQCGCLEASFLSDWPGLMVQKCGLRFFHVHDEEFEKIIFRCSLVSKNPGFYTSRPILKIGESRAGQYNHQHCTALFSETRDVIDQSTIADEETAKPNVSFPPITADEDSHPGSLSELMDAAAANVVVVPDFHLSILYNQLFPPSKVTQEWFSHQNRGGHSVTVEIPPNLYNDSNWMGLALCASFSMCGDPKIILDHLRSETQHCLQCQFRMSVSGLGDQFLVCRTNKTEIMWLLNLGQFIWISYIPSVEPYKNILLKCSRIEASFGSDWPGVIVQKCGLRILYHHDQVEFEQKLKHCNTLISEYGESINRLTSTGQFEKKREDGKKNFVIQIFRTRPTDQPETDGTDQTDLLGKRDLLDFDGCFEYNLCFPPREILDWFSHRSNGPSVTIDVPVNLYDDSGWMGLFLCAYFSVHEDQTEKLDSAISHQLICSLESNVAGPEPELHVRRTTKEEFRLLYIQDEFLWLSYIPRGSLPDWLNQCSCLEASFYSNWPGLMVQKCGLRFFHMQDEEGFEQIIYRCSLVSHNRHFFRQSAAHVDDKTGPRRTSSSNNEYFQNETSRTPIYKGESTNGAKNNKLRNNDPDRKNQRNQSNLPDFDPCLVYNSCFPPNEILDWFSHRSDEPPVTIRLPRNLYNDPTWMGLALCVFFSVEEQCTIPCNLICLLETAIGSLEPPHMHCLAKEDLMLLRLGGFIWLSYIPRGSFPNWLNQSSFIEALIATDYQGLTVQRCGFRLLYQNEEIEFKETIRRLSQTRDVIDQLTTTNEKTVKPSTASGSDDPRLKDKGKTIVEE